MQEWQDELSPRLNLVSLYGITEKQAALLENYAICGNVGLAAERAGCHRNLHSQSLKSPNSNYAKAYKEFCQPAVAALLVEDMILDCLQGEIIYYQGQPVIDPTTKEPARKKSDILRIYMSKAIAGLTDQPKGSGNSKSSGPQIHIHMPEQHNQPPTIEVNEADDDT